MRIKRALLQECPFYFAFGYLVQVPVLGLFFEKWPKNTSTVSFFLREKVRIRD
jgi:hypothetical protein